MFLQSFFELLFLADFLCSATMVPFLKKHMIEPSIISPLFKEIRNKSLIQGNMDKPLAHLLVNSEADLCEDITLSENSPGNYFFPKQGLGVCSKMLWRLIRSKSTVSDSFAFNTCNKHFYNLKLLIILPICDPLWENVP